MLKKTRCLLLLVAAFLVLCAGLPKPSNDSDTLVIGSLVLDYPDGFFGEPARTIDYPINLEIMNSSTGSVLNLVTKSGGYFYFLTNGRDNFVLTGYSYMTTEYHTTYSARNTLSYQITVEPGCVQYLGHIKVKTIEMRKETDLNRHTTWTSKISMSKENKLDDAKKYLQDNGQGTPWLDRAIHSVWTIPTGMSDKDFRDLVETGSPESIETAVKNGANVNARDTNGTTMLMYAASHNQNPDAISVLLNAGADIKARSSDGSSVLMFAARHTQNAEVVTTLLKAGADINAQAKRGTTALMLAARYNQTLEVITTLLTAGADTKLINLDGKTALDYAKDNEAVKGTDVYQRLQEASQ